MTVILKEEDSKQEESLGIGFILVTKEEGRMGVVIVVSKQGGSLGAGFNQMQRKHICQTGNDSSVHLF